MSDTFLWIVYVISGATLGLITLPIFSGNGKIRVIPDTSAWYVFGFSLFWPLLLLFLLWHFIQWYRCCWVRYFMRLAQLKKTFQEKDFSERWKGVTEVEKIKYDFKKREALHLANMKNLTESIENRRYFLETQSRKGYWN
jgi:hypothetical protein